MSCWVVPAVAAEIWNLPVNEVLARIRGGTLEAKSEYGFTLVDVAPQSPTFHRPLGESEPRPLTFKNAPPLAAVAEIAHADSSENDDALNWRAMRISVGRLRRPPQRSHLAA
jgi:hypothetical protein